MFCHSPMLEFDEDGISDDEYDMDGELVMLGDIVISMERAREQANEFGHRFLREVAFDGTFNAPLAWI